MKYIISDEQIEVMKNHIQEIINSSLDSLREESEEWGLGEMDEIEEVESVKKIEIEKIVPKKMIKVYVNLYKNSDREDFFNIMTELNYRVSMWFPNVFLQIKKII